MSAVVWTPIQYHIKRKCKIAHIIHNGINILIKDLVLTNTIKNNGNNSSIHIIVPTVNNRAKTNNMTE